MLKGKFFVASYELFAQASGEAMIVKLVKETEEQSNGLMGSLHRVSKQGFAGNIELYIYDTTVIETIKRQLGKEIELDIKF